MGEDNRAGVCKDIAPRTRTHDLPPSADLVIRASRPSHHCRGFGEPRQWKCGCVRRVGGESPTKFHHEARRVQGAYARMPW